LPNLAQRASEPGFEVNPRSHARWCQASLFHVQPGLDQFLQDYLVPEPFQGAVLAYGATSDVFDRGGTVLCHCRPGQLRVNRITVLHS
jgi:hypothetical protein